MDAVVGLIFVVAAFAWWAWLPITMARLKLVEKDARESAKLTEDEKEKLPARHARAKKGLARAWCAVASLTVAFWIGVAVVSSERSGDLAATPTASDQDNAQTPLSERQIRDARLALCAAAADEYPDVLAGKGHKDAITLANQYAVGERAGGRAIGHEWGSYENGAWKDGDCRALSVAQWAPSDGYAGDPIDLPRGAISVVVKSPGF